jgi:hypothetical protein
LDPVSAPGEPTLLWHAFPLGLLGADQGGADRTCRRSIRELIEWLPHVASLGADGLLLGPVFASLSHGYDTVSHRTIDDRLGAVADLDALLAAASSQGIGVVLDGAFAYASRAFWRLTDPAEPGDPWFARDDHGNLVPWRVDSLVTPDYDSTGYQSYVADVLTYWLDRGVAGWRLDSAWSVPASFWRRVLTRVRETHPSAWFLGQVFDDDLPPVANRTLVSSTTEYALDPRLHQPHHPNRPVPDRRTAARNGAGRRNHARHRHRDRASRLGGPPQRKRLTGRTQREAATGTSASSRTGRMRPAPGRAWVAYSVSPTNVSPPTRLPTTVGISFQTR